MSASNLRYRFRRRRWLRHKHIVKDYAHRFYILPGVIFMFYYGSDSQAAGLHDHPFDWWSIRLWGCLSELIRGVGSDPLWWKPWDLRSLPLIYHRKAKHAHAICLHGKFAATLLICSRRYREWGFWTKAGWVPHYEVVGH